MKKNIILSLFILISTLTFGQGISKLRAESMAVKFIDDDGSWKEWTDWLESDVLTVMDFDKQRITLYTEPKEIFDIVGHEDETNDDGDEIMRMFCVDNEGIDCVLKLIYDSEFNLQLYIEYENMIVVYNVNTI